MTGPVAWSAMLRGYDTYVFPHDRGHISAVIIRPTADPALGGLRHRRCVRRRGPVRSRAWPSGPTLRVTTPTSGVLVGGRLLNRYRPQLGRPGLVAIGDARGHDRTHRRSGRCDGQHADRGAPARCSTAGLTPATIAVPFGAWCDTWIRPWVEDHLAIDSEAVKRWQGADLDPSGR